MSLVVPGHGYTLGLNGEVPSGVDRQGMATAKAPPADATRRRPQRRNPKPAPYYARSAPPPGMMYSQEDPDFGVSPMSDEELQEAMSALKPDFLDQMIQRLEPKKQSPQKTADMVKPDYQQAWKWDGNQVRALSEEEQAAQAKAKASAARRHALPAQLTRSQVSKGFTW